MSVKSLMFLTSALASAGMVIEPVAVVASDMNQLGTWGMPQGAGKTVSNLSCDGTPGVGSNILQMNVPRVQGANGAFHPNVNAGANVPTGNVTGNIGFSKPLNVYNHNNDNPGARAETAGNSIDASSRTYFGKPLNVYSGATDNNSQAGVTGNSNRSFAVTSRRANSEQPITTYGTAYGSQGAQTSAVPQSENSRLFGGTAAMPRRPPNIRCSARPMPAASMPSASTAVDNSSHFGGFGASHTGHAGVTGAGKIDADTSVQLGGGNSGSHPVFSGNSNRIDAPSHFAGKSNAGKIDADTSVRLGVRPAPATAIQAMPALTAMAASMPRRQATSPAATMPARSTPTARRRTALAAPAAQRRQQLH